LHYLESLSIHDVFSLWVVYLSLLKT
jgi:hypothetical protein